MGFNTFLRDFYCLPIRDILLLLAVATGIFLRMKERFRDRVWWKVLLLLCLAGSSAVVLYLTVSTRESAGSNVLYLIPFHSYREVLNGGNPEILRSNFMNVILFYPAGLLAASLLPGKWPGWMRVMVPFLTFTALSVCVECYQYANAAGLAEMDDVIHNSFGVLVGGLCSRVFQTK